MDIKFTLQAQYAGSQFVAGPFNLSGTTDTNITYELATNVSKNDLLIGYTVTTPYNITGGTIQSLGTCIATPVEFYTLQFSSGPIIVGNFDTYSGVSRNGIVKLDDFGNIDYSFNIGTGFPTGAKLSTVGATNLLLQSDGKLLVTMESTQPTSFYDGVPCYGIIRLNPDGSRDYSFNPPASIFSGLTAGDIYALGCQSDGKIIVGGSCQTSYFSYIMRLMTDGTLDPSFTIVLNNVVRAIAIQPDDKILVAGAFTQKILRLNSNGVIDSSFVSTIGAVDQISTIAIENDGRILLSGTITTYNGVAISSSNFIRVNTYGNRDTVFSPVITTLGGNPGGVQAITVQPDNNILIGGFFTGVTSSPTYGIGRILPTTGAKDTSFTGTGITYIPSSGTTTVNSINLLPNGDIFITGRFITYNGFTGKNQMVKIKSTGAIDSTFVVAAESATLCDNFDSVYIT
jgi:uncharacterized delta-60 repeat protein